MAKGKNIPEYATPATIVAVRQHGKAEPVPDGATETIETVGPGEEVRWFEPEAVRARPGIYAVRLDPCPRRIVETGLPAGPAAEAVAREKYMAHYELIQRPGKVPTVELLEP